MLSKLLDQRTEGVRVDVFSLVVAEVQDLPCSLRRVTVSFEMRADIFDSLKDAELRMKRGPSWIDLTLDWMRSRMSTPQTRYP